MNSILFESIRISNVELRNRFVMSAAADNLSTEAGHVSSEQISRFSELAGGGVGLIISGAITVHPTGTSHPGSPTLAEDSTIDGWKRLSSAVHERGAKIAAQLCHSGIWTSKYQNSLGRDGIAASVLPEDDYYLNRPFFKAGEYHAATEDDLELVIQSYGEAARRARESGFDGVQLHGAHDSLLAQFLSPCTNRRRDRWGGSGGNRLCLHREIYCRVREKTGSDFPVTIKLGVEDGIGIPDGLKFPEGKSAALSLADLGFNALEISQGLQGDFWEGTALRTVISRVEKEAYFRGWCREISKEVTIPTMLVGGLRTFELMEEIVRNHEADCVSLCRPLIREPGLINDWRRGDTHRATCISCNKCAMALAEGKALTCSLDN
jgi:2,4-dienoyl-CoA reductase-like NADH-dependent reductase (Old Yellow Enzyme family)